MRTKKEYYEHVLKNRELVCDPAITRCTCPNPLCDWHGKCKECVALHRHYNDHVPFCLQPILRDKIEAIAATVEAVISPKTPTPLEHRQYIRERDKEAK